MSHLASLVADHRVIVCVGSGGVGKTTSAAALALWGALHGRRTAVLTIDPAKRLADCLGLDPNDTIGTASQPVAPEVFAPYGITPSGTLTALLVEQDSAWKAAIERYLADPALRTSIFANRFYQGLSQTFAGSHEYMALDTLAGLLQQKTEDPQDAYDLIVVDTPPTHQSIFLKPLGNYKACLTTRWCSGFSAHQQELEKLAGLPGQLSSGPAAFYSARLKKPPVSLRFVRYWSFLLLWSTCSETLAGVSAECVRFWRVLRRLLSW